MDVVAGACDHVDLRGELSALVDDRARGVRVREREDDDLRVRDPCVLEDLRMRRVSEVYREPQAASDGGRAKRAFGSEGPRKTGPVSRVV